MALLVTLFLVLINIFNSMSLNSPKVDGFTAVSAWIFSCIMFVFGALMGYAGLLFQMNVIQKVLSYIYQVLYAHGMFRSVLLEDGLHHHAAQCKLLVYILAIVNNVF